MLFLFSLLITGTFLIKSNRFTLSLHIERRNCACIGVRVERAELHKRIFATERELVERGILNYRGQNLTCLVISIETLKHHSHLNPTEHYALLFDK